MNGDCWALAEVCAVLSAILVLFCFVFEEEKGVCE